MKISTAYAIAWVSTAFATSVGVYISKDASYLWAMIIPLFITISSGSDKTEEKE